MIKCKVKIKMNNQ